MEGDSVEAVGGFAGKSEKEWVSERDRGIAGVGVHGGAGVRGVEGHVRRCDDGRAVQRVKEGLDWAEGVYQSWVGGEIEACSERPKAQSVRCQRYVTWSGMRRCRLRC